MFQFQHPKREVLRYSAPRNISTHILGCFNKHIANRYKAYSAALPDTAGPIQADVPKFMLRCVKVSLHLGGCLAVEAGGRALLVDWLIIYG